MEKEDCFRRNAILGGISGDEMLFDCTLEGTVEHQADASHRGAAETGLSAAAFRVAQSMLQKAIAELPEIMEGQLGVSNAEDGAAACTLGLAQNPYRAFGQAAEVDFSSGLTPAACDSPRTVLLLLRTGKSGRWRRPAMRFRQPHAAQDMSTKGREGLRMPA